MKVAIYTLTRDRFEYTKKAFGALRQNSGYPYDHFIVDNGSQDGTVNWLKGNKKLFKEIIFNKENKGIGEAGNQALDCIFDTGNYDIIIKFDNDCIVSEPDTVLKVVSVFGIKEDIVISPRVTKLNKPPKVKSIKKLGSTNIEVTGHIGGIFLAVMAKYLRLYRFPKLALAKGYDSDLCHRLQTAGFTVGYIQNLFIEHYKGTNQQALDYPEYFERKKHEEIKR